MPTLVLSPASIAENGGVSTVTATLSSAPTAAVTLTVAANAVTPAVAGDFTLSMATTLTFAASATMSTGTVTLTAVNNDVDAADKRVTVSGTVASTDGTVVNPASATLTITDDDTAALVVDTAPGTSGVQTTALAVTEGGGVAASAPYTVALATEPSGPVTVGVASGDQSAVTVAPTTLTYSATTWNTVQTVTATAVDDANPTGETVTVTHAVSGTADTTSYPTTLSLTAANVTVTVTDNDTAGIEVDTAPGTVGVQTTALVVTEEDATAGRAAYTVRLTAQPAGAVTVRAGSGDPSAVTTAPAALVFSATTWNTAQTVMARAVNDADQVGETVTVTHTVSGTADATSYPTTLAAVTVTVQVRDNDRQVWKSTAFNFDVSTTVLFSTATAQSVVTQVPSDHPVQSWSTRRILACAWTAVRPVPVEGGLPAECMVINDRPNVTGTLSSPITPTQAMLDNGGVVIGMTVTSATHNHVFFYTEWVPLVTPRTPTLVLSPAAVTENGGVATVTARLSSAPTAAVTLTVAATAVAPAGAGDVTLSPGPTLTFAAGTATSTGTVTLTAVNNAVDAADKRVTVTGTVASSDDRVIDPAAVTLTITDDDTAGVTTPTDVSLAEGSETAYSVVLATEPAAAVTVTVASGSTAVTVETGATPAPRTLLFTPMTWNTARAVTVRAAADTDHRHETATLTHAFSSGDDDYAGLRPSTLTVEVTDTTDLPVVTVVGGTTTGEVNGHPWLIRRGSGVPAGVRVDLPERTLRTLRGALTVTIQRAAAPATVEVAPAADMERARRFFLGPEAARLVVDITVTTDPAGGLPAVLEPGRLEVCLPVSDAVRQAAAAVSRPVHLLHDQSGDGVWTVVPEEAQEKRERCDVVSDFSPFAVGYESEPVTFSADDLAKKWEFTIPTGRRYESPPFPLAKGERPIIYRVKEDLPPGLGHVRQDGVEHGGTITGTARTPMEPRAYTLVATAADKTEAELPFTIEVKPGIESRDLALVLAGIGRTLATDAVEILGSRGGPPPSRLHVTLGGQVLRLTNPAGSAPAAASSPSPLAGEGRGEGAAAPAATSGPSPWQRVTGVAVGVARALGVTLDAPTLPSAPAGAGRGEDSMFPSAQRLLYRAPAEARRPSSPTGRSPLSLRPVSAKDLLARSAFELPLTRTGADGLPTWTLWGRGAASGFSGQPEEGFKMDGTLYSGYLGLDYRQDSLLMGLAVAHSTGTVDYERTGGTKAGVDVKLTSLLPYAHWQPSAGLGVWGLLGAGWGEMDLKAAGDPSTYTTALTSWLGAVGGRQALTTWQGIDLAAKTDAFLTTLRSEAKTNLPGARGHAERVRLLLEGRTAMDLSPVSRVQPRLEVGGRWDSGTAEQGLGLELGGGLAYTQTAWGLSVAMQGRYLLMHEDGAFEDWGASVNVRLDPGVGGEGAYLTVAPVWGQAGSGVEQLWGQAAAVPVGTTPARAAGWRPGNVEVDVGYGLALADGRGRLTPYGGLVLGDPGTARYRLGSRWAVSTLLDLSVEGERAEQSGQAAAHTVSVRLGWQW